MGGGSSNSVFGPHNNMKVPAEYEILGDTFGRENTHVYIRIRTWHGVMTNIDWVLHIIKPPSFKANLMVLNVGNRWE